VPSQIRHATSGEHAEWHCASLAARDVLLRVLAATAASTAPPPSAVRGIALYLENLTRPADPTGTEAERRQQAAEARILFRRVLARSRDRVHVLEELRGRERFREPWGHPEGESGSRKKQRWATVFFDKVRRPKGRVVPKAVLFLDFVYKTLCEELICTTNIYYNQIIVFMQRR
jgi:hypothetical protein